MNVYDTKKGEDRMGHGLTQWDGMFSVRLPTAWEAWDSSRVDGPSVCCGERVDEGLDTVHGLEHVADAKALLGG